MRVFVLAGEASGDRLGAAMMAALNARETVEYTGVGGPLMTERGLTSLFAMDELSVMGIAEILPKYRALKRRISETADAILRTKPDVVVTIDSPDFCFRVAAIVKNANPSQHITHYVAPSVWAWRPKRAAKLAKLADQVLCLLPFEPSYFTAHGLRADFVGHPVVAEPQPTDQDIAGFQARYGLEGAPTLLLLPGSRKSEANRLLPVFGQTLTHLVAKRPDLRVITVAASGVADRVGDAAKHWSGNPVIIPAGDTDLKRTAFGAANVALAASGTVSLELAAARTPMAIAYDMHWLTWQVMSRMAMGVRAAASS
ncbi:MAG: lipid-A-disaccharide synthase, partial [Pseudomonadota bacterium]